MKKNFFTIFLFFVFFTYSINPSKAINIGDTIKKGIEKNIELAIKGKKLNEFFSGNKLTLSFEGKKKEYRFQAKKYEVFEDGNLTETGKWKVSGILKNQIRLKAENKKKSYYFKKIAKKAIIYHFDTLPSDEKAKKTLVEIEKSSKFTDISSSTESTSTNTSSSNTSSNESKDTKVAKKKKKKEAKKKKEKKYKYEEMPEKYKKKYEKLKIKAKNHTKVLKKNENEIHVLLIDKILLTPAEYVAATHCGKYKKFVFEFWDSANMGEIDPSSNKRASYFVCSKDFVFTNPKTGSKILWSNYDDPSLYKYPDEHLYLYRGHSKFYNKTIKEAKKKDPNLFKGKKDKPYTVYHKDENSIHIKGKILSLQNLQERNMAAEHCAKYDKYYYFFANDFYIGKNGSVLIRCSHTLISSSPTSGGALTWSNDPSVNQNTGNVAQRSQNMTANASQLKVYNASSMTTFYFFEASHNFMSSLELLYRAYDENTKADELKAQIDYNKQSKYSESQKLKSTKSIIDQSSVQITAKLTDTSLVLSELGRSYYEQSLPHAFSAAENAYNLFIVVKNTKERVSSSGDLLTGLLDNLGEVVGIATIIPEIPAFTKNMVETSRLIFNGAKTKKIRDKGNLKKALDQLNLDV